MIYKKILALSIILIIFACQLTQIEAVPEVSAKAYLVMDAQSGRILKSHNANLKLPIASTTKIMTAILAIETIEDLNQRIEVPPECCGIEGSSIYLKPKQMVSVIDLLYGTMLRSGNDAAAVLAKFAGRNDPEGFISMMNRKAKELGALNTNFANPNGLHDDNHYSTAYDLALISGYAMKNEIFREIASSEKYKAESMNNIFYNKNKVVYQYKYGTGIKIGYTKAAGRCLVASAEKEGTQIIAVLLNDNTWFNDSYRIFDWAFENYKTYSIAERGQFVRYTKDKTPVFIDDGFRSALTDKEIKQIRFEALIEPEHMSSDSESKICGSYNIYLGKNKLHTGRLITQ
ncbi:MAG: D-alanyl-D-alanine carboxypeptidase family protein [Bacillota bacterium]|mgnify:CR=1 FL=1|nr:D-alanyl-D-alanine carboxypeptidase family protein [Bacillota bacterium]